MIAATRAITPLLPLRSGERVMGASPTLLGFIAACFPAATLGTFFRHGDWHEGLKPLCQRSGP